MKNKILLITTALVFIMLSSCSLYIDSFTNNLNTAITSSNDPQTIMQALPAYIVLVDSLIESEPNDQSTLLASVNLMNAYSSLLGSQMDLVEDLPEYAINNISRQRKILNEKALFRAEKALCIHNNQLCQLTTIKFKDLKNKLKDLTQSDIEILYKMSTAWVSWIQVNTDDWNAMAQIAQIKLILNTVVMHENSIDNGNAHVYLGVLNSIIPASLGGKPALGKKHFEAALLISKNSNLMAKALYAEYYARLIFDENLHKKLISEILKERNVHGLINTLAVEKAKALQRTASDYF